MTNTDISQAATKKDIQELTVGLKKQGAEIKAQRTDSKRTEKSLRSEILRVEKKVENLEDGQKRLETKIDNVEERLSTKLDKIANTLDGFVGTIDTLRTENIVGAHQTQELRTKVTNHEKRIIQLESYPHAA